MDNAKIPFQGITIRDLIQKIFGFNEQQTMEVLKDLVMYPDIALEWAKIFRYRLIEEKSDE